MSVKHSDIECRKVRYLLKGIVNKIGSVALSDRVCYYLYIIHIKKHFYKIYKRNFNIKYIEYKVMDHVEPCLFLCSAIY